MKTQTEIFHLILKYAKNHDAIRIVTLEGSRVNTRIKPDIWQDYDISFFVPLSQMHLFIEDETWLQSFGHCLMMQKPECMELFEPDLKENWFSFLMLFEDGIRLDFKIIPLEDVDFYIKNEHLMRVLLDKDSCIKQDCLPSDKDFWIKPLTQRSLNDCSNEFYWLYACAYKAILRKEVLLLNDYLHDLRSLLFIMLSWKIGLKKGFHFSLGKSYKFLPHHITPKVYKMILKTYHLGDINQGSKILKKLSNVFYKQMKKVTKKSLLTMPKDKKAVKKYCKIIQRLK